MEIRIKDGIDTWVLETKQDTDLNKEIEFHARALIKIAGRLVYGNTDTQTEVKII